MFISNTVLSGEPVSTITGYNIGRATVPRLVGGCRIDNFCISHKSADTTQHPSVDALIESLRSVMALSIAQSEIAMLTIE